MKTTQKKQSGSRLGSFRSSNQFDLLIFLFVSRSGPIGTKGGKGGVNREEEGSVCW